MIEEKKLELLRIFLDSYPNRLTCRELAVLVNVSEKSVQNYIKELNALTINGGPIIFSTNKGYDLDYPLTVDLLKRLQSEQNIPQTPEQRVQWISKYFLLEEAQDSDVFTICEELFISFQTLKNDVKRVNDLYADQGIQIRFRKNRLVVVGSEESRRKAISKMIYEEASHTYMNDQILYDCFDEQVVTAVKQMINDQFENSHQYINDFSKMNLLLHVLIILSRVQRVRKTENAEELELEENQFSPFIIRLNEYLLENQLPQLSPEEARNIAFQFAINSNPVFNASNQLNDKELSMTSLRGVLIEILQEVAEDYHLDIIDQSFFEKFLIHISTMLTRLNRNDYIRNPLKGNIKTSCPVIFEIAIAISIKIMERFSVDINEDEVAFIALHIGFQIEKQMEEKRKIKLVLFFPEYGDLGDQFVNNLLIEFGSAVSLLDVVSEEESLKKLSCDLLLSTVNLRGVYDFNYMIVPPFYPKMNKMMLLEWIDTINQEKIKQFILEKFDLYFEEDLFIQADKRSKFSIIHELCERLQEKNYVPSHFETEVCAREEMSSTGFGSIAIPHSQIPIGKKTKAAVCISKKGIEWDTENKVHIIFLIAIKKDEGYELQRFYQSILQLFQEEIKAKEITSIETFNDFKSLINSK